MGRENNRSAEIEVLQSQITNLQIELQEERNRCNETVERVSDVCRQTK